MSIDLASITALRLEPLSARILFPYLAAALAVAGSLLHHRRLRTTLGDARGMWVYFGSFFLLFLVVPAMLIVAVEPRPLDASAFYGIRPGNWPLGLLLAGISVPIVLFLCWSYSKNPGAKEQYPFSKDACANDRSFALYELGYAGLYFTSWEFLYRGVLFFPLAHALGYLPAAAITTTLSTLHHIGHPEWEIFGALAGGFLFSLVAVVTGSLFYPFFIHALLGVGDDFFIYRRYHRAGRKQARTGRRRPTQDT
jgi:membrane protease YdiL (CAAX protease family)